VKTLRYVLCDVFTDRPLAGNPLAVFTDARGLDAGAMQALARELNLSETAFVLPPRHGGHAYVRIFTPSRELPFAGHPTLGTAFVLGGPLQASELRLEVDAGIVPVQLEREGARVSFGWMTPPRPCPFAFENPSPVLRALGLPERGEPLPGYDDGRRRVFIPLATHEAVAELAPDFAALGAATDAGVYVYHFDGESCKGRYFAPAAGVNEDAATGAAAGPIALMLRQRGALQPDAVLRIEQGAEIGRPSTLYCRVKDAEDGSTCVEVGGCACIVARGQFLI
jgi:trans-2,3-dihydro-3-hydroxyanthranilate isomerase